MNAELNGKLKCNLLYSIKQSGRDKITGKKLFSSNESLLCFVINSGLKYYLLLSST